MNEIQDVKSEYIDIIEQLACDTAKNDVSLHGKIAISEKLVEYIEKHKKWLADLVARVNSMQKEYQATIDRVNLPTKLYNEFLDIAKKFNFPISDNEPQVLMYSPHDNPNKVSREDIDFIIKNLPSLHSNEDNSTTKSIKEEFSDKAVKTENPECEKSSKNTLNKTSKHSKIAKTKKTSSKTKKETTKTDAYIASGINVSSK